MEGQNNVLAGIVRTHLLHWRGDLIVLRGELVINVHGQVTEGELAIFLGGKAHHFGCLGVFKINDGI